ncbi:ShlB/FhaC/HecB family hemolysin secretion/activation protein [Sandarakinorhabdus sp.]|uniref:ShlB/FhaC/HecB family hemolysin secretion/activation protein n=1 Tax=Sandarakinorhabdus sp. TaxID=1916663 RepID=UPI0035620B8F
MTSDASPAQRRSARIPAACSLALFVLWAEVAAAQIVPLPPLPPQADISRQRVLPLPLPDRTYDLNLLTPERSAVPRAVDEIEFSVSRIRVTGATVFSDTELAGIFAPLEGRKILLDDLRRAAERLEGLYRARGHFLTRVLVPPQVVRDETLDVQVLEGFIAEVFVDGPNASTSNVGRALIGPVTTRRPVRLVDLESPLLLLNDMPGIRASSVLKPGIAPASSDLLLKLERKPTQSYLAVSNFASDVVGPFTVAMGTTVSQPFGFPGAADLSLTGAGETLDELQVFTVRYATPVGRRGAVVAVGLVLAQALPGGEVAQLGIRSRSGSGSIRARVPILRTRANAVFFDAGISVNRSRVSALGEPITNDRNSVADVALAWRQVGWLGGDMNLRLGVARGLMMVDANDRTTPLPSVAGFSPEFSKLTLLLQRNQPLAGKLSAAFVLQGQYSGQLLLAGERLAFGGSLIGRGYDPSSIIGDKGLGGLAEFRFALPRLSVQGRWDGMQLYAFGDMAVTTMNPLAGQQGSTNRLASLGIGLRALAFKRLAIDAHVAGARRTLFSATALRERINFSATLLF